MRFVDLEKPELSAPILFKLATHSMRMSADGSYVFFTDAGKIIRYRADGQRLAFEEHVKEIEAGHGRHHHVGQQQVDRLHRIEVLEGFFRCGGLDDAMTSALQNDPHQFTHGTSEQRIRWFRRGFETGDARQCATFKTD